MRQHLVKYLAAAFLVIGLAAAAEDKIDCANAVTTVDLNACAKKEFDHADKALNAAYKEIMADLTGPDPGNEENNKKWAEALKVSQRAWVAFRVADCEKLTVFEAGGGTATTGEILGCMTELTEARTKSLKARYEVK